MVGGFSLPPPSRQVEKPPALHPTTGLRYGYQRFGRPLVEGDVLTVVNGDYRYDTEVVPVADSDTTDAEQAKAYLDARFAQGWELVSSLQFYDGSTYVWKKPRLETR